jgi:hypothetical protein
LGFTDTTSNAGEGEGCCARPATISAETAAMVSIIRRMSIRGGTLHRINNHYLEGHTSGFQLEAELLSNRVKKSTPKSGPGR